MTPRGFIDDVLRRAEETIGLREKGATHEEQPMGEERPLSLRRPLWQGLARWVAWAMAAGLILTTLPDHKGGALFYCLPYAYMGCVLTGHRSQREVSLVCVVTLACGLLSAFVAAPLLWGPGAEEQNGAVGLALIFFIKLAVCIVSTTPMLWRSARYTMVKALLLALNLFIVCPAALLAALITINMFS